MRKLNLQLFAEPAAPGAGSGTEPPAAGNQQQTTLGQQTPTMVPAFDYDKLAQIVAGKQTVTEETVLKGYFKQQGLSKEQMNQAIATYKQQQADSQPDVTALQQQAEQAQAALQQAQIENAATLVALELGLDAKTIPYLLKMADLSNVTGQDGKINDETMKTALNTVLEAVPALKPQEAGKTGFTQIGTGGNPAQQAQQATTPSQTATKRWNRFN